MLAFCSPDPQTRVRAAEGERADCEGKEQLCSKRLINYKSQERRNTAGYDPEDDSQQEKVTAPRE